MTHKIFEQFLENRLNDIRTILCKKSADYSTGDDKLFNFKLAASIDRLSPIEALRGMDLKHRASISQGLDELEQGKVRPWEWWLEKITDNINYQLLLLALICEEFYDGNTHTTND